MPPCSRPSADVTPLRPVLTMRPFVRSIRRALQTAANRVPKQPSRFPTASTRRTAAKRAATTATDRKRTEIWISRHATPPAREPSALPQVVPKRHTGAVQVCGPCQPCRAVNPMFYTTANLATYEAMMPAANQHVHHHQDFRATATSGDPAPISGWWRPAGDPMPFRYIEQGETMPQPGETPTLWTLVFDLAPSARAHFVKLRP